MTSCEMDFQKDDPLAAAKGIINSMVLAFLGFIALALIYRYIL